MFKLASVAALAATASAAALDPTPFPSFGPVAPSKAAVEDFLGFALPEVRSARDVPVAREAILARVAEVAMEALPEDHDLGVASKEYPWFAWLPAFQGSVFVDGDAFEWEAPCFSKNSATAVTDAATGDVTVTVSSSKGGLLCSDNYMIGTMHQVALRGISSKGDETFSWTVPSDEALAYDLANNGIRFFKFDDGWVQTIDDLLQTLLLLTPELTEAVGIDAAARNVAFLKAYTGIDMQPRVDDVSLPASAIRSGDFFGIIRLDGLDPMLAWAMGQQDSTGHTTVAVWDEEELYVVESTVLDSYWPADGVQRTPYEQWVEQARAASFQTVHLPLSDEWAAKFNETAAWEFFDSVQGVEYGYQNMLFTTFDSEASYPTVPGSAAGLSWENIEVIFGLIEQLTPDFGDQFYYQAWNKRLGTDGLSLAEMGQFAGENSIDFSTVPFMPEDDSWLYNTTRYDEPVEAVQSVCCVQVCRTWKAAGLFNDIDSDLNCAEFTNSDDFQMTMFTNNQTQITGNYTLELNLVNTIDHYPHMRETCGREVDPTC